MWEMMLAQMWQTSLQLLASSILILLHHGPTWQVGSQKVKKISTSHRGRDPLQSEVGRLLSGV